MKQTLALVLLVFGIVGCATAPSVEQRQAKAKGFDDYKLCFHYFDRKGGSWRSKDHRYQMYIPIVQEIDSRNLDCRLFPEFASEKEWKREWIKEYEEQI